MEDLGSLSERELDVLKLVATGATNQEIARTLVISPNTVKVHLRNIFEKLGVQSRTEATVEAVRRGWVTVPGALAAVEGGASVEGEAAPPAPLPPPPLPLRHRAPIVRWQRLYLLAAVVAVLLAAFAPGWWQARTRALPITPFSDLGRPPAPPAPRTAVQRWVGRDPLPSAVSRLALAADATRVYAVAGETAAGVSDALEIFDPANNIWTAGPRKPTAVSNVQAALIEGRLYVPGGATSGGSVTNVLEVYDPAVLTWEARAPLPLPAAAYGLAASGGKLYLFGGYDGKSYRAETFIYDAARDAWLAGTPLPAPRAFHAAAVLEGAIYVLGGYDGERELDSVLAYDPAGEGTAAGPWAERSSMGQARGGLAAAALGSRLYAVGGGWSQPLTFNEQYDTATGAWSRITTPIVGQWRNLGLTAQGQKLYAVGGWSGSYLDINEEYQALLRQLLPLSTKGG
jgi:DNA-binding CsgD family transcriptional regulator/N-acetylneuraminic acid mutarotase